MSGLLFELCPYAGLFAGFNKDSAQQFFIEDASHVKHTYDLTRLCLPQESADICLIKHTGQPYSGQYSTRNWCCSIPALFLAWKI
jgi:hypothetical protein